jgi:hypothetical protein
VAILLDQDAIPLVTTEDQNEILLEPTWNSTEEKAARKRKRKNGKTAVEKAEEEAQLVAKTAERDRRRKRRRRRKLNARPRWLSVIENTQKRTRRRKRIARRRQPSVIVKTQKRRRRRKLKARFAEHDRKRAEKEAEEEAKRAAKKWTPVMSRSNTMSHVTFKMCQFILIVHLRDYHYDFMVLLWCSSTYLCYISKFMSD